MKVVVTFAASLALMAGSASAATYYVAGSCGSFDNPSPQLEVTGTWTCPTAASLGITGPLTVSAEFIDYSSDYSNGEASSVTITTDWSFSGAGVTFAFGSDTTTSTGGSISTGPVSSDSLPYNPLTDLPPTILAGFYDTISTFGTPTINWTNEATAGSALAATGYAEVIYAYNVASATPEPVSMALLGTGLLMLGLVRLKSVRRYFSRSL